MVCEQLVIELVTLIVIMISAIIGLRTLIATQKWNKKKVSQEILDKMILGELPDLISKIRVKFDCDIYNKEVLYEDFVKNLSLEKKKKFDDVLIRILNIFEAISINIERHIIIEKICYDYISLLYTTYYDWAKSFINERRIIANDNRVYENFQKLAIKWNQTK